MTSGEPTAGTGTRRPSPDSPYGPARSSEARECVARAAGAFRGAFTVDELAAAVRGMRPGTGTATVYRAVGALEASGWLERIGYRDGTALFARCTAQEHHHHLVCTGCGATVPTDCTLGEHLDRTATEAGFRVTSHEVRVYGLCPACVDAGAGRGDAG